MSAKSVSVSDGLTDLPSVLIECPPLLVFKSWVSMLMVINHILACAEYINNKYIYAVYLWVVFNHSIFKHRLCPTYVYRYILCNKSVKNWYSWPLIFPFENLELQNCKAQMFTTIEMLSHMSLCFKKKIDILFVSLNCRRKEKDSQSYFKLLHNTRSIWRWTWW